MSIAPSTDIVAEVARAADPARAAAVTAKLNALSSQGADSPQDFAAALDATGPATPTEGPSDARGKLVNATVSRATRMDKAHTKLESVLLTEMIGEMLPKDTPSAYGQGYAGDMWRSMLAERVADQIAGSGRLGIASRLFAGRPMSASSELTAPGKPHEATAAATTLASSNALSAPSQADIEHGAVMFARTKPL